MATEEKTINVVGMHCPSCVAAVELFYKRFRWGRRC